jgi:uncharacterized damage-inducible protein DinB
MSDAANAKLQIEYAIWTGRKLLDAASKLDDAQWADVRDTFAHALGTYRFWHALWTTPAGEPVPEDPISLATHADAQAAYEAQHATLFAFAASLTDAGCARREAWWRHWNYEQTLPLGETITQVSHHMTQHRAEIAEILTKHGCSPGDLDYLNYAMERDYGSVPT